MLKIITLLGFFLICHATLAQLNAPQSHPVRAISDPSMLIQFGGQKLELLPTLRAIRQSNNQFKLINASGSDLISKDSLGVGFSHSSNANVLLNGEISVKLNTQYSISSLANLAIGAKPLVPPNIYLIQASTPIDIVKIVLLLQNNAAIEWVEPMIISAKIN